MNTADEGMSSLFSSLVDATSGARLYYSQGSITDTLQLLQHVKQATEHLEQRLLNQDRGQNSASLDDLAQLPLPHHAVSDSHEPRWSPRAAAPHSLHISYGNPSQSSFKTPTSPGPFSTQAHGNLPFASMSGSRSRPASRSGSESSSSFQPLPPPPGAQGKSHQYSKEVDQYGDSQQRNALAIYSTASSETSLTKPYLHDVTEDSHRYSLLKSAATTTKPTQEYLFPDILSQTPATSRGHLTGSSQPLFRQRHTSLPQILSQSSSPHLSSQSEHSRSQHQYLPSLHQPPKALSSQYGLHSFCKMMPSSQLYDSSGARTNRPNYYPPEKGQHYRQHSPSSPQRSQREPDYSRHHPFQKHLPHYTQQQQQQPHASHHQQPHYERYQHSIDEHPWEESYHKNQGQYLQQPTQHCRAARRSSQPSHIPDQRERFSSILDPDVHDLDRRELDSSMSTLSAEQDDRSARRGSGGSTPSSFKTTPQHYPSSGSPSSSYKNGSILKTFAFGGMATTSSGSRSDNSGSRAQFHAPLEPEVVAKLDDVFFKFLQRICSDLNACDSKGDHIHQPLMAKKMQRLEASTDFRPFKFRIQAFTNAFHDDLVRNGLTEDILPLRKVKVYLWKHRYISRFNEDGKKQKSKGNHVWNIEARKISNLRPSSTASSSDKNISYDDTYRCYDFGNGSNSSGNNALADLKSIGPEAIAAAGGGTGVVRRQTSPVRWEFREYSSRIAGQVIKFARVDVPYVYSPRIWDAQMSCPAAKFSSPWLPPWLKWHKGELKGIPGPDDESCTITVIAEYVREGEECRLEMSFPLMVSDPSKEGELIDSPNENDDEDDLEEELDNRPRGRERGRGRQRDMDRQMEVDTPRPHERNHCHEYRQQPHHQYQHHHRGVSQSSQLSQCQALQQNQAQLQHLQLQDDSQWPQHHSHPLSWQCPQREERKSDEEQRARDEPREIADDFEAVPVDIGAGSGVGDEEEVEESKLHVRKQSRERLSFILVQDPKRRRHD